MKYGIKTDRGQKRELNEDYCNVIVGYPAVPACFIVADGMGGHQCGEIASKKAVEVATEELLACNWETDSIPDLLKEIILRANQKVYEFSQLEESTRGMGTTLIVAVFKNRKLYIGHVGDSRVYLIREGSINKLTWDHSFIEELVKNGSITRDEAQNHPKKNLITRAVGYELDLQVDTYEVDVKEEDVVVLCTDGLTNMLIDEQMLDIINNAEDLQKACDTLVETANNNGGEDNITVILGKI